MLGMTIGLTLPVAWIMQRTLEPSLNPWVALVLVVLTAWVALTPKDWSVWHESL
jgi:hypothetical protein